MQFTAITTEQVNKKVKAFIELFDHEPQVILSGTFEDEQGELVFFDIMPKAADRIGNAWIEIELDGQAVLIKPVGTVSFKLLE